MAEHNDTGREGEALAASWLEARGFEIIRKNWRYSRFEIDIIASLGDCIHFVEVKTRKTSAYGLPEEQVSNAKLRQLIAAGAEYLYQYGSYNRVRYDILAINIYGDEATYLFIEDVYT